MTGLADSNPGYRPVPEREVVAVRTSGPHEHIERVRFSDGTDTDAATAIAEIREHRAHYIMRRPDLPLPLLIRVQTCPDCNEDVLWA